jgi:hypothetical protein
MSWQDITAMMAPKEERAYWLARITKATQEWGGMPVNCRYMPSLERTPVLRQMVRDKIVIQIRQERKWARSRSRRTVLAIPVPVIPQHTETPFVN